MQAPWYERAERVAAVGRAWIGLAREIIGMAFLLLVFGAFAWCLWTGFSVVAHGTEDGARNAGRTLDAFLSALSAPALGALGFALTALLAFVVLLLRGGGGRSPERSTPGPQSAPPWTPASGGPGTTGWPPTQPPLGPGPQQFPPLPPPPAGAWAWALEGPGGGAAEEADGGRLALGNGQRRRGGGVLSRRHSVMLLTLCGLASGPEGVTGRWAARRGRPPQQETVPQRPAAAAVPGSCLLGQSTKEELEGLEWETRTPAGGLPAAKPPNPGRREGFRLARARVLLDAGANEIGEAAGAAGQGAGLRLVLHGRNKRLDPYRGVRVGDAAVPGPDGKGKGAAGKGKPPPRPPDHYSPLRVFRDATLPEVKQAYRRRALTEHPDKGGTAQRFRALQEAYRVLADPALRCEYERQLAAWEARSPKGRGKGGATPAGPAARATTAPPGGKGERAPSSSATSAAPAPPTASRRARPPAGSTRDGSRTPGQSTTRHTEPQARAARASAAATSSAASGSSGAGWL